MNGRTITGARLAAALLVASAPVYADSGCSAGGQADLEFSVRDVAGREVRLTDYRGKVVLLNFWATWCAPCREEIPLLVELHETHRERGLVVLGVSVNDPVERLVPFVEEHGMRYPIVLGQGRDDLMAAYGPPVGFPTSILVARDGRICLRHSGLIQREPIEELIIELLTDAG